MRLHPSLALPLLLLLTACMPSRREVREAVAEIAPRQPTALTCTRADRCALPSPVIERAEQLIGSNPPLHHASLIDFGQDALLARIHLIRAARRTIDMQAYIFVEDGSGSWVMEELLAAARRGVRVRLLVDQLFSSDDLKRLAQLALMHRNFEMRMYNPTFGEADTGTLQFAAGILCCFTRFNQRMHNKLLLVDGIAAVTGGRNVQDRYFDWDPGFNYRDRDLLLLGPANRDMQASFESFWEHRLAVPLPALRDVRRLLDDAASVLPRAPWDGPAIRRLEISAQADSAAAVRARLLDPGFDVGAVEFYSDLPNKPLERNSREERALSSSLRDLVANTEHELVMQTPYLVFSRSAQRSFRALQQSRKPDVLVSTNSLASTDAFPVYALSHKYKRRYLREFGFDIYEYKPFPEWAPIDLELQADGDESESDEDERLLGAGISESQRNLGSSGRRPSRGIARLRGPLPLRQAGVRLGMHAKSMVIDRSTAIIGTHNFDPRSDRLNTESFVVVHDAALAGALRRSMLRDMRPENAWTIARRPRPPVLSGLNYSLGKVSEHLPLFDIWPWRYATSYEMLPGCSPVPPGDPGFAECYRPVGDFPEVAGLGKGLYTRIITAFGAGLSPIL